MRSFCVQFLALVTVFGWVSPALAIESPEVDVEAIFDHSNSDYYVLCADKTWSIADEKAIEAGAVCKASPHFKDARGDWNLVLHQGDTSAAAHKYEVRFGDIGLIYNRNTPPSRIGTWSMEKSGKVTFTLERGKIYGEGVFKNNSMTGKWERGGDLDRDWTASRPKP